MKISEMFSRFFSLFPVPEEKKPEAEKFMKELSESDKTEEKPPVIVQEKEENKMPEAKQASAPEVTENKELIELRKTVEELKERDKKRDIELSNSRVDAVIDEAIRQRKIAAKDDAAIANFRKLLNSDFESAKSVISALPVIAESKFRNTVPEKREPGDMVRSNIIGSSVPQQLAAHVEKGLSRNKIANVPSLN